jgi:hypothetical protein
MVKDVHEQIMSSSFNDDVIMQFYPVFFNVFTPFNVAAMIVHLWLPLFAICVIGLRLLNYIFVAAGWAQWFIKQGRYHPLDAVGYVAAILVFAGTFLLRWVLAHNDIELPPVE